MKRLVLLTLVIFSLVAVSCSKNSSSVDENTVSTDTKGICTDPGNTAFGSDFQTYLNSTGNSDLTGFGGASTKTGDCLIAKDPVIFIHGNGDNASGSAMIMGGWGTSKNYFKSMGYKPTELYAVNYGQPGMTNAALNYHSPSNMSKVYRFIVAVKNYTGRTKVDIISHSLGVTLVRRAVKGGTYTDYTGASVNLGASINALVDTFVGIAGANRGLNSCGVWPLNMWTPTCGPHGLSIGNTYLANINGGYSSWTGYSGTNWKVGSYTYTIYSYADELGCLPMMPTTCYVWSVHTSAMRGENGSKVYYSYPYGHMGLKEQTAQFQYKMVVNHTTY
jgi:hypothetical protein